MNGGRSLSHNEAASLLRQFLDDLMTGLRSHPRVKLRLGVDAGKEGLLATVVTLLQDDNAVELVVATNLT